MDKTSLSSSTHIKHRVYKQFIKTSDQYKKGKLHVWFNYIKLTTVLAGQCKTEYYESFFQENKTNSKKVCESVRSNMSTTNNNSIQNISSNIEETITMIKYSPTILINSSVL